MKRTLSFLLLLSLLTAFCASCGDAAAPANGGATADPVSDTTAASAETTAADEVTEPLDARAAAESALPALDFEGTAVRVGYVDSVKYRTDIIGEQDGDVVNEAIYTRNLHVEETLNVTLSPVVLADSTDGAATKFQTLVLAGDDAVDCNTGHQSYLSKRLFEGLFYNLADDRYISWDSPWWNYDYMHEFTIGRDRLYFLFGDISLMMLKSGSSMYFNKGLFDNYFKPSSELYEDVLAGNWTLDDFYDYTSSVYQDLNGNGKVDNEDLLGMTATTSKSVEHFQYDANIVSTTRGSDDVPVLTLNNEKTVLFAEKLYHIYYENPGALIYTSDSEIDKEMKDLFQQDLMLFYPSWFYSAEYLREMESDFGIIPYPKLDETQDEYRTLVHNGSTTFCVPLTIRDDMAEIIGAVLEDMAFESYKLITPAYFEVAMKNKYSRDDVSAKILDILHDSYYTNFGYCYSSTLNSIGMLRPLASGKTADFASWYAKNEAAALVALDNLVTLYLEG